MNSIRSVRAELLALTVSLGLVGCGGGGGNDEPPVAPSPSVTISATPASIARGQTTQLTWASKDATACTASGDWSGSKATSGSANETPTGEGARTYTLACTGPGGSGAASVVVNVAAPAPAPAPTVALSASPSSITAGQSTALAWSATNATACTASGAWTGVQATSGQLNLTPGSVGNAVYTLTCTGPGGSAASSTVVAVEAPRTAPTVTLAASPANISVGQTATLSWSSTDATSCIANGGWATNPGTGGSQPVMPSAAGSFIYTLTCTGPGGTATASAAINASVPTPAPTVAVSVSPANISTGQSATLSWSSTNATTCAASGAWSGTQSASGTRVVTPAAAGTHTYTLTCTGAGGSGTGAATVTVTTPPPSPAVSLSALPASIATGQSSTLTWSSTNATSCTASGAWSGAQATSGTQTVAPTSAGTYVYTLTCTGAGGTTASAATITVTAPTPSPTVSLSVQPASITTGQSSTLTWSSTNATSCTASGAWSGAQATSGGQAVTPTSAGTYVYTLTCTGAGGTNASAATLAVTAPTPSPTVSLSVSPTAIVLGQGAQLTWSAANSTGCTASGAWSGARGTTGSVTVTPSAVGSSSYTLNCTGPGGSATATAVLDVTTTSVTVTSATCGVEFIGQELFCRVVGTNLPDTTSVTAAGCTPSVMLPVSGGNASRREFSCTASTNGPYFFTVSVPGLPAGTPINVIFDRFLRWGAPNVAIPTVAPAATSCSVPVGQLPQDNTQVGNFKVYAGDCIASLTLTGSEWNALLNSGGEFDHWSFARQFSQVFRDEYDFLIIVFDHIDQPPGFFYSGKYQSLSTRRLSRTRRQLGLMILPQFKSSRGLLNPVQGGPMLHELMHEWANYNALPTAESGHWGFASVGGQLGGFNGDAGVQDLGGGQWSARGPAKTCLPGATDADRATYCAPRNSFGTIANGGNGIAYAPLELYLMGLKPASAVAPIQVANGAAWVPGYFGQRFTANSWSVYSANDVAARMGVYAPVYGEQRHFRIATLVLTPNATLDIDTLSQLNSTLEEFSQDRAPAYGVVGNIYINVHNFYTATEGLATIRAGNLLGMRR